MKWRTGKGRSHVPEYPVTSSGRLKLGTPCFSGPLLKKRFETQEGADDWVRERPKSKMTVYECFMCDGWHLTGRKGTR